MGNKLNQLQGLLPAGLLVDAEWLQRHGYYSSLVAKYVKGGWLEQPVRGAYRRAGAAPPGTAEAWPTVVLSLQRLRPPLPLVGGRTALEAQGYSHDLSPQARSSSISMARARRPAGRDGCWARPSSSIARACSTMTRSCWPTRRRRGWISM